MISERIKQFFIGGSEQYRRQYSGGVLPSVLFLLVMFSLIFAYELRTYKQEAQLYHQTKEYYQAKTIERLTLGYLRQQKEDNVGDGTDYYNIGSVNYTVTKESITLLVSLDTGFSYEVTVERLK